MERVASPLCSRGPLSERQDKTRSTSNHKIANLNKKYIIFLFIIETQTDTDIPYIEFVWNDDTYIINKFYGKNISEKINK